MATADAPIPLLSPGGLFEIVFSFYTSGPVSHAIKEVKGRFQDMIKRLQFGIPGIRLGVMTHGDFRVKNVLFLEKHVDLTTNVSELCKLVQEVGGKRGGGQEESYEYILKLVAGFDWTPGSQRALVLIADSIPHGSDYPKNGRNLDCVHEAKKLANMVMHLFTVYKRTREIAPQMIIGRSIKLSDMQAQGCLGVKIYVVNVLDEIVATRSTYYEELAGFTSGTHLKLTEVSNLCDSIMAICYRERGDGCLESFEAEIRARERLINKDLEGLFGVLGRGDCAAGHVIPSSSRNRAVPLERHSSISSILDKTPSDSDNGEAMDTADSPIAIVKPMMAPIPTLQKSPLKTKPQRVVMTKSNKVSVKHITSKNADTLRKEWRHKVRDTNFILMQGNLKSRWSKWKLAVSNTEPKSSRNWIKRSDQNDNLGWKRKTLFPCELSHALVLYEVAIQKKKSGKMTVVFSKWSILNANPLTWEKRLFGRNLARINSTIEEGSKVFVRRFTTKQMGKHQKQTVRDYKHRYQYVFTGFMKV